MANIDQELGKELEQVGASKKTSQELLVVARMLSKFPKWQRSSVVKAVRSRKIVGGDVPGAFAWPRTLTAAGLLVLVLLVILLVDSQKSIPGDTLYPVKRWSEEAAVRVNPQFQTEIPVRRSEEVQSLVKQKKNSNLLERTLADYKEEVAQSQEQAAGASANIAESVDNLEEAKANSSPEEQQQIENVLAEVEGEGDGPNLVTPPGNPNPGETQDESTLTSPPTWQP